jgi:hypothetical protein
MSLKAFSSPSITPLTVHSFVFMTHPLTPSLVASSTACYKHKFLKSCHSMKSRQVPNFTFRKKTAEKIHKNSVLMTTSALLTKRGFTLNSSIYYVFRREDFDCNLLCFLSIFENEVVFSFYIAQYNKKRYKTDCFDHSFHFDIQHCLLTA